MGTHHRNHCPSCLWSKHVDLDRSGDRKATCQAEMEPIGLTFKKEGVDKYGKLKQGELMVVNQCTQDGKMSINRIAADDNPDMILKIFEDSQKLNKETKKKLAEDKIDLLTPKDETEIKRQLFGKTD